MMEDARGRSSVMEEACESSGLMGNVQGKFCLMDDARE